MADSKLRQYVHTLDASRPPAKVGNKAINLHRMLLKGVRIPRTHVVTWEAYEDHARAQQPTLEALRIQVAEATDPARAYAVRSSANIEDSLHRSFAGQFDTLLGVQGEQEIMRAILSVWEAAHSPGVQAYVDRHPLQERALRMAVILQEMVEPVVSGVSFSRNPISGEAEVIVEAVEGPGTALVQHGVTPLRWVHCAGKWKTSPPKAPLEPGLIADVVEQTGRIAGTFKMDVDLEWVFDGQALYWVQMREISGLKDLPVYSNRIAREVLPGMIKPLIWSINVPLINSLWIDLFAELTGRSDLAFDDLARSFYFRAYFNLSALGQIWAALGMPQESLEMLMGILPRVEGQRMFRPTWRMARLLPRLVRFTWNKWRLGGWFEKERPILLETAASYDWQNAPGLSEADLLVEIDRLYADLQRQVYYNINVPLLMALYNTILNRLLHRVGVDPARFDVVAGMPEYQEYAPDRFLQELRREFAELDPALRETIRGASYVEFRQLPDIALFQERVGDFLRRFGHLSDSGNDFSATPWREQPELVLRLIALEADAGQATSSPLRFEDLQLAPPMRFPVSLIHRRARQFRLYREQISSLYTYTYGLFRPYYLALGDHLKTRGALAEPADVYFLTRAEIRESVTAGAAGAGQPQDLVTLARARRAEMERCRDVQLPTLIYGNEAPLPDTSEDKLTGVATSRGSYTGPVRVVRGLEDFDRLRPGDVLVIPYSDVGWTPLFARAGAVIAESGGMLSHSSIVAREYQIPAVVSVPGAMTLKDDMLVTVDGYHGEIVVHAEEAPPSPES